MLCDTMRRENLDMDYLDHFNFGIYRNKSKLRLKPFSLSILQMVVIMFFLNDKIIKKMLETRFKCYGKERE
jgi:hypothetical protein